MLGRERAAKLVHRFIDEVVDQRFLLAQKLLAVFAFGHLHVVVQIAVAQVAEVDQAHTGNFALEHGVCMLDKSGNARGSDRDIVLDVQPFLCLRQRNALADMPQLMGLCQAFGYHGVDHAAVFKRQLQQMLKAQAGVLLGFAVAVFQQHAVGRLVAHVGKRYAQLRHVLDDQRQCKLAHHLKTRQARTQMLVRQAQQAHGCLHAGHGGKGGELRRRLGEQLHGGSGDDAQRAFAANEQIAQVVAGVVFAQTFEAIPDLALGRDYFQTQAQLTRISIAHHLRPACVRAQIAANGATAFSGQGQREQQAFFLGHVLQVLQDATGFHGEGQVVLVDMTHGIQARQVQHDLLAAVVGGRAHRQASVAALGNDLHMGCCAGLDHGGDFCRVAGAHHGQRLAVHALAPVLLIGRQVAIGEDMGGTNNLAQGIKQSRGGSHGWQAARRQRKEKAEGILSPQTRCWHGKPRSPKRRTWQTGKQSK